MDAFSMKVCIKMLNLIVVPNIVQISYHSSYFVSCFKLPKKSLLRNLNTLYQVHDTREVTAVVAEAAQSS